MASKLQEYRRMSEEAQRQLTGSLERWQSFLATASRLYKYPYHEQVMIHAQRPDATACAEFDVWNNTMRRYVRRGSKGIALIDTSGDRERLRYVFDVSDTGTRPNSRSLNLWELREEHIPAVSSMLEKNYGVPAGESLAVQLEAVASQLAREYWEDNRRDILGILEDSFLEEYDEFNVGVAFRNAAEVSISYSLMLRCGLEPENYFEHEDFMSVFDFNTPETAGALGTAVSGINQQVLREIGATIRNYEREQIAERSMAYENDVQAERGLSDPGHQTERAGGYTHREVRADAETVPEGASPDSVEPTGAVGAVVSAPSGDRRDGAPETGRADAADGEAGRRDGRTEAQGPAEMGGHDEYAEGAGRGDHSERAGVQLTADELEPPEELNNGYPAGTEFEQLSLNLFLSEQEQISQIDEADRTTEVLSAFSFAQTEIDDMLRFGSNTSHAREHIADAFQKQKPIEEIAALLQREFHGGYGIRGEHGDYAAWYDGDGIHLHKGREARYAADSQVITWEAAAERIGQMLEEGSFASNVELAEAGGRVRSELAQSLLYLKHDLSEEANRVGYFSSMDDLPAGYPDATAALAEKMEDNAFADTLRGEFLAFLNDYAENRGLLRFHYHRMDELWQGIRDKLLRKAISAYGRTNKVKAVEFDERLRKVVEAYNSRDKLVFTSEVVADFVNDLSDELIKILQDLQQDKTSFEKLGISYEEKAFYDILVKVRDDHGFPYEEEKCLLLAKKIKELVDDKAQFADWSTRDDIKNQLNMDLTVLLYKNGYPPEWDEEVFEKVMEQAENFKKYADVSSDAPGPAKAKIYQYAPSTSAVLKVAEEPAPYGTKKN